MGLGIWTLVTSGTSSEEVHMGRDELTQDIVWQDKCYAMVLS